MKKVLASLILVVFLVTGAFADDTKKASITFTSEVLVPEQGNPGILIGVGTAELSSYVKTSQETTTVTGINLMEDGDFSFALITSEEVFLKTSKNYVLVEVTAEGFHRYEYDDTGSAAVMDETAIVERDAVPLLDTQPEINIPMFSDFDDEINVSVTYAEGKKNKVYVTFNPGTTKSDLVVGTFKVQWNGRYPLDAGIYKAKVSVVYSTP